MSKSDIKIIYSLRIGNNKNRNGEFCGYRNKEELLDSLLLTTKLSNKFFSNIELYCDSEAVELINESGRDFKHLKINNCLDCLNEWLLPDLWSFSKLYVYNLQTTPFIHLDIDVFLWKGIGNELSTKRMIFQGKEIFEKFKFYSKLYNEGKYLNILPDSLYPKYSYAVNCGVFGILDEKLLPMVNEYYNLCYDYTKKLINNWDKIEHKKEHCVLFEQAFIVSVYYNYINNEDEIGFFLDDNCKDIYNLKYTHLMVGSKRNEKNINNIKEVLKDIMTKVL